MTLSEYLSTAGLFWLRTVGGRILVFDAPPDYCGVCISDAPSLYDTLFAERGWLTLHGADETVIAQLRSAFAR